MTKGDQNALNLKWVFGFNQDILSGVHSLSTGKRNAIFYIAANTGVIYDYSLRKQRLLQGHCNPISCCAVSEDKKWIVTADAGKDSILVIWDAVSGTPIKTYFNPHPYGIQAVDISKDSMYVTTVSYVPSDETTTTNNNSNNEDSSIIGTAGEPGTQQFALWEWTVDRETPLYMETIPYGDFQTCIRFNPSNPREVVTNGQKNVIFWYWDATELVFYSPAVSHKEFRQPVGKFNVSCFLEDSSKAITGTVDGQVILWDAPSLIGGGGPSMNHGKVPSSGTNGPEKTAAKLIHLVEGCINSAVSIGKYICLAGEDGAIRFYDYQFRLEAWFEDLNAGAATSVSFACDGESFNNNGMNGDDFLLHNKDNNNGGFYVPDFIVGTKSGYIVGVESMLFDEIDPENRRGTLLVQGLNDEVHGLATNPKGTRLVIVCYNGAVQLWDYENKVLLMLRTFDRSRLRPRVACFDPTGKFVAIGFTSGAVRILHSENLSNVSSYRNSENSIIDMKFSSDGEFFATADADNHVAVWIRSQEESETPIGDEDNNGNKALEEETEFDENGEPKVNVTTGYTYLGRYRSHTKPITGLDFVKRENGSQALISVGEDRRMVEYDLSNSSAETGIRLVDTPCKIEQTGLPTACLWHPLLNGDYEDRIITANSEFKLKQWNGDNKSCRRTSLGPTFGGPINRLISIPVIQGENEEPTKSEYLAYSTHERVIGLAKLPLDGNPNKSMGLIAHPGEVSMISVGRDGKYLFSAGGADRTVNMWKVNTDSVDAAEAKAGYGIDPYLSLLEGGEGGELYEELKDYFYYCQLRTQGEDTTDSREAKGFIPLEEIPTMMRALGYYPTQQEISNMVNEVKYSVFTLIGETLEYIDLNNFIKLFINHRPVYGLGKAQLDEAFTKITGSESVNHANMTPEFITKCLTSMGEKMTRDELEWCLNALTGEGHISTNDIGNINSTHFAENVLGFEDVVEGA